MILHSWAMPNSPRRLDVRITRRPTTPAPMVQVCADAMPVTDLTPGEVTWLASVVPELLAALHHLTAGSAA